jgi:hypothetical protein
MTENYAEMKWNKFEASGKVADYLQYKGVNSKTFTDKAVTISDENPTQAEG